jgi:hypothetical protein
VQKTLVDQVHGIFLYVGPPRFCISQSSIILLLPSSNPLGIERGMGRHYAHRLTHLKRKDKNEGLFYDAFNRLDPLRRGHFSQMIVGLSLKFDFGHDSEFNYIYKDFHSIHS